MLLIFPLEVAQASFLSSLFLIWYVRIVNFRRSEEVCGIGAFVFADVILFHFLLKSLWHLFQFFFEFWQLSFGLSIKSTHEIERSKVARWNGTDEFWEKSKVFGTEWQMVCFTCWLFIPEQILWLDIPFIRLYVFLHIV